MEQHHCLKTLRSGAEALGLTLNDHQLETLLRYAEMIEKWNKVYNLSAIKTVDEMVSLHLLDSLTITPFVHGQRCLDVGTGAGLPGIPLAIALPNIQFDLLDTNSKKTRFLHQVKIELKLENVGVYHQRVEDFRPQTAYDTVTARAFTSLPNLLLKTRHLLMTGGKLLAMKSSETETEQTEGFRFDCVFPLTVPQLNAQRNLVVYEAT